MERLRLVGERALEQLARAPNLEARTYPSGTCEHCSGSGWEELPDGRGVTDCRCKGSAIELRLRRAKVPSELAKMHFGTFPPGASEAERAELGRVCGLIRGALEAKRSMLLQAPNGRGKTGAAIGALRYAAETLGLSIRYVLSPLWLLEVQSTFGSDESAAAMIAEVSGPTSADVLLLDDLGWESSTDKPSEWTQRVIGVVLDQRHGHGKRTIATTNLPWVKGSVPGLRETLGPRAYSRLQAYEGIEIRIARDFRAVREGA